MVWDNCGSPNYDLSLVEPNAEGVASSGNVWSRYVSGSPSGSSNDPYPFPVIGDLVSIDTSTGRALRYNLLVAAEASRLPFGVVVGLAFNPLVYPAFGGALTNRLAIATVGIGSELLVYRITGDLVGTTGGVYVNPEDTTEGSGAVIRAGDPVRFVYHRGVGRWGVRKATTGETAQAIVLRVSDVSGFRPSSGEGLITAAEPQKGLHIRLVQPFTVS